MYDCPSCGAKGASFDGTTFCGKCEARYHAEQEQQKQAEIAELQAKMDACKCEEGMCGHCMRNHAHILLLRGGMDNEAIAHAIINQ